MITLKQVKEAKKKVKTINETEQSQYNIVEEKRRKIIREYRDKKYEIEKEQRTTLKQRINYKPIDTIKDNQYIRLKAFIIENDRPKNKFTLMIGGTTIFNGEVLELPYSYGLPSHNLNARILKQIKCFSTKEEAISYYKRNKEKFLKGFLTEVENVIKEYEGLNPIMNTNEWKLAYWEDKKYYYENQYSGGIETKEYQEVLEKLKELGVKLK